MTAVAGSTLLITGANRGLGRALLEEALHRGARQVYVGTRATFAHPDERVTPLLFDVTDPAQTREAAGRVATLDILVNNAGVALYDDLGDRAVLEHHLAVNLFGVHGVTQAFLPLLTRSGGAVVNNLAVAAIAPLPIIPAYSISKAAAYSLTLSQRALLADRGVRVHAVLTGPADTDMSRDFDALGPLRDVRRPRRELPPDHPVPAARLRSWPGRPALRGYGRSACRIVMARSRPATGSASGLPMARS